MFSPEPGKVAEVEIKHIRHPGDVYFSSSSKKYIGMIEEPMSWLDSDQFQMHAGNDSRVGFTSRVIRKENIISIRYLDGSEVKEQQSQAGIEYSEYHEGKNGEQYLVQNKNQKWTCECKGFQFRRQCKHIKEAKDKI